MIESRRDPVAGVVYNITPNGPVFSSLYELIEEGQRTPLIQNHVFNVQLTCSPPKVWEILWVMYWRWSAVAQLTQLGSLFTPDICSCYWCTNFLVKFLRLQHACFISAAWHGVAAYWSEVTITGRTGFEEGTQRWSLLCIQDKLTICSLHCRIQVGPVSTYYSCM